MENQKEQSENYKQLNLKLDEINDLLKKNGEKIKENEEKNNERNFNQIERIEGIHKLVEMKLNKHNLKNEQLVNDITEIFESFAKSINQTVAENKEEIIKHIDAKMSGLNQQNKKRNSVRKTKKRRKRQSSSLSSMPDQFQLKSSLYFFEYLCRVLIRVKLQK